MDLLGRVRRYVPYKDKRIKDPVVDEFLKTRNIRFVEKYAMCLPNSEAMTKSIAKYNVPQPVLDQNVWKVAGDWTVRHFHPYMGNSKVISQAAAVAGADRTTSAGYPWSLWFLNKGAFLDSDVYDRVMAKYWESLKTNQPFMTLWTASLKRELRDKEKLAENKIRTFTASAAEHSIALNRMSLDMNEKFYSSNNKTWSFVGCSKFNRGFDRLYKRLSKHPNAFELDESSFDASLFREAMEGQRDIRWELLHPSERTPENKQILWNLYDQVVHSLIVLDNGQVVQKHTGNPSGSANTIVDNTMILFRLFAYAWLVLAKTRLSESQDKNEEMLSYSAFMKNVEAALNGDDNTFTASNEVVGWFNPRGISRVWTGIGVTTKTPCWEPRKLEECEFLSQSFLCLEGIWVPKPERDKVLCSLLWGSEFIDVRWTLLRCYALRIESWADAQLRQELMDLIWFIRKTFAFELQGQVPGTQISMKDIECVYKTDAEIWRLYSMEAFHVGKSTYEPLEKILRKCKTRRQAESLVFQAAVEETPQLTLRKCSVCHCEVVTFSTKVPYTCKDCTLKIESVGLQEVSDVPKGYKSPQRDKWRGKGQSWKPGTTSPRFTFVKHSYSRDTEMAIPNKMSASNGKRGGAAKKGKNRNKPNSRKGGGGSRQSQQGRAGGVSWVQRTMAAPIATGRVSQNKSAATRITHREALGPIVSTGTGFQKVVDIPVNPAFSTSFPWLSAIAAQYETYAPRKTRSRRGNKAHAIRFVYETRCATTKEGTVVMVTNYDATEAAFTSLSQAENYRGATVGQPWISFAHELEVDAMRDYNRHYCRAGSVPDNADVKTYDVGNFQLFIQGVAAGQIGELYAEYDIDLFDPRTTNPLGQALPMAHIVSSPAGTATAAALFGTSGAVFKAGSNLTGDISVTGNVLTFGSAGRYLAVFLAASSGGLIDAAYGFGAGAVEANILVNDTKAAEVATEGTNSILFVVFDVTAPGSTATLTFSGAAGYAGGNTDVLITQLSSGLTRPRLNRPKALALYNSALADRKDEKSACEVEFPRRVQSFEFLDKVQDLKDEKGVARPQKDGRALAAADQPQSATPGKVPTRKGYFSA